MLQRRQVSEIECESVSVYRVRWVVYMALLGVYKVFLKVCYSADKSLNSRVKVGVCIGSFGVCIWLV